MLPRWLNIIPLIGTACYNKEFLWMLLLLINDYGNLYKPLYSFGNTTCNTTYNLCISLETLSALLDWLIKHSPPLPLKTMLVYGRYTRSTHVNLPADTSHGCIRLTEYCFQGEGMIILRCRPKTYCCHDNSFFQWVFYGLLAEIIVV